MLVWQMGDLPVLLCDNGVSYYISQASTCIIGNRQPNATMRTARGKRYPIEDFGDLPLTCRSSGGEVPLLLCDVAHVPSVSYHVFFRVSQPTTWHTYTENKNGVRSLKLVTLYFPCQYVGRLGLLCAYRPGALVKEKANASIEFGPELSNRGALLLSTPSTPSTPMLTRKPCTRRPSRMVIAVLGALHECRVDVQWRKASGCQFSRILITKQLRDSIISLYV